MTEPLQQFQKHLKTNGYSLTVARQTVFTALQDQEPQTMHELVGRCPGIDRASIYRTIALLEQLAVVQRLHIGWKYKLELTGEFIHHHHHLSCTHCGKTMALPEDDVLEKRLHTLARARGFYPQNHQLEIRGICGTCHSVSVSPASSADQS